jgi:hypothetical protein
MKLSRQFFKAEPLRAALGSAAAACEKLYVPGWKACRQTWPLFE